MVDIYASVWGCSLVRWVFGKLIFWLRKNRKLSAQDQLMSIWAVIVFFDAIHRIDCAINVKWINYLFMENEEICHAIELNSDCAMNLRCDGFHIGSLWLSPLLVLCCRLQASISPWDRLIWQSVEMESYSKVGEWKWWLLISRWMSQVSAEIECTSIRQWIVNCRFTITQNQCVIIFYCPFAHELFGHKSYVRVSDQSAAGQWHVCRAYKWAVCQ